MSIMSLGGSNTYAIKTNHLHFRLCAAHRCFGSTGERGCFNFPLGVSRRVSFACMDDFMAAGNSYHHCRCPFGVAVWFVRLEIHTKTPQPMSQARRTALPGFAVVLNPN